MTRAPTQKLYSHLFMSLKKIKASNIPCYHLVVINATLNAESLAHHGYPGNIGKLKAGIPRLK